MVRNKDDWKKFEKHNVTIDLNVLYAKREKIYSANVSKKNSSYFFNDSKQRRTLS